MGADNVHEQKAVDPSRGGRKPPVVVQVQSKEALNAVLVQRGGMTFAGADSIVSLGAAFVGKSETGPWTRLKEHRVLDKGAWLKFFPEPQRFAACHVDWQERVLHKCDKYIIIDKPPGLPCQGVESNSRETAPKCASEALKTTPLLLAHRLDACASGALVLARTRLAQSLFTQLQGGSSHARNKAKAIVKEYVALVTTPPPASQLGHDLIHYMAPDSRGPALVRTQPMSGWKKCVLQMVDCTQAHDVHPSHLAQLAPTPPLYQVTVRLDTGRRHQIRAQLSAIGSPIWRDSLYAPLERLTLDLEHLSDDGAERVTKQIDAALRQPTYPECIALQAARIEFIGIRAHAGAPWWRLPKP
jgi:23S rRNA pseudouridine1911/1915/1917 synthase